MTTKATQSAMPRLGPDPLERFLAALRSANEPVMTELFLRGQCYALWRIVREVFPDAEFWELGIEHAYIGWRGRLYDIRGRVRDVRAGWPARAGALRRSCYARRHVRAGRRDTRRLYEDFEIRALKDHKAVRHRRTHIPQ